MLQNMNYYHNAGQSVMEKMEKLLPVLQERAGKDVEMVQEFMKMLQLASSFRERAQDCAVDAAPYLHAKLSAVAISTDTEGAVIKAITESMAPKDAAAAYQTVLMPR